ncbi:hypothetical protein [Escherichia coli]|uniref:hypothetical protein n=1 Tax=Escherichia coli TaxID=562 RepID=UPI001CF2AD21|nr:hypothetical protein [Escherichia coli]
MTVSLKTGRGLPVHAGLMTTTSLKTWTLVGFTGRDITDTKWRCGGGDEAPPTTGIGHTITGVDRPAVLAVSALRGYFQPGWIT